MEWNSSVNGGHPINITKLLTISSTGRVAAFLFGQLRFVRPLSCLFFIFVGRCDCLAAQETRRRAGFLHRKGVNQEVERGSFGGWGAGCGKDGTVSK